MQWFISLSNEDQEFIRNFMLSSGSLKELAKIYDVSYPTVRLRLNNIIEKIKMNSNNNYDSFESKIMNLVIDDELSLNIAKKIINDYRSENYE